MAIKIRWFKNITPLKFLKRATIWTEFALLFSLFFVGPPYIGIILALMAGLLIFYWVLALCK